MVWKCERKKAGEDGLNKEGGQTQISQKASQYI